MGFGLLNSGQDCQKKKLNENINTGEVTNSGQEFIEPDENVGMMGMMGMRTKPKKMTKEQVTKETNKFVSAVGIDVQETD